MVRAMTEDGRPAWAVRLQAEREARGWNKREMARQLHSANGQEYPPLASLARQIRGWENGDHFPRDWTGAYATAFQIDEVALFPPQTTETTSWPTATPHVEHLRRELADTLTAGMLTDATLDDWDRTVWRYGRATRDRPAAVLVADLAADLAELNRTIARCHSASTLRSLTRVVAQMAGLMCLTLIKLDDRHAFRGWARTARLAADEAGDQITQSWVLAQEAYGHYYAGDMLEAVYVAQHAQELAMSTACVGAALAAALQARAHAALGDQDATHKAIRAAETLLASLSSESRSSSAFGYNEAQLRFHEGNALTHIAVNCDGDTTKAIRAQDRALQLYPADDFMDRALTRLDRAVCMVRDGDTASAMEYALDALTGLTDQQRQGIITTRGHEIVSALPKPQQALRPTREFHDLLMLTTATGEDQHR